MQENRTGRIRPSILAPAGNKASFLAAVAAGADGIYCGLKQFSARMEAKNFSVEQLIPLARLAQQKNIGLYIALNALIKSGDLNEVAGLLDQVVKKARPKAIIIQDLGLVRLARQVGFSGQIHLSTLANVSFPAALKLARQDLRVDRVVVPRELDIDEIKAMAAACAPGLCLEVFVHGALCYGVSGRCYWSSYLGGKSGLRGKCVQPCRRFYSQNDRKGRFFSCHDLSLDVLAKVLLSIPQVTAWKIEGRKKGPHYVYHTVKAYQIFRDHSADPVARREALALLEFSLGRPGTHYRFLPQRPQNPLKTDVQTGSGLLVGRTKGRPNSPYITTRKTLLQGDSLRLGYEDEAWHGVHRVKRFVPKKGRLDLTVPSRRPPRKGTPVFLVDRKEQDLKQTLAALENQLSKTPSVKMRPSAVDVRFPRKAKRKMDPVEVHVYRNVSSKMAHRKTLGLWLSPESVKTAPRAGKTARLWWWLPPVVWPKDEGNMAALVDGALKGGGKDFVLNAPWQKAFFPNPRSVHLWAGPFCNLANPLAIGALASLGFSGAVVSPELGSHDFLALPRYSPIPLGVVISGNWPLSMSRVLCEDLKTNMSFVSPKGEQAWVKAYENGYWVYPNWVVDLQGKTERLKRAGYSLFVHLIEPVPKGVRMKQRPGLWNWDLGLA